MNATGNNICFAKKIKGSDSYLLYGNTFAYKDIIKEEGGKFVGDKKAWIVSRKAVERIHAGIQMRVRVAAHCHTPEEEIIINEGIAKQGFVWLGCSRCDRSEMNGERVEILEIIGEEETSV